jgi:HSP20 family protein
VTTTTARPTGDPSRSRRDATADLEVVLVVTRFDPFRDLDRLAERVFSTATDMGQAMRAMPLDVFRAGDHYLMLCDLPGIDPGSIDVSVDGRTLTVRAERSARSEDVEWLTRERPTGTFVRQVTVGNGLDLEHIEASYTDGVLALSIPVAEQAKPRKIAVAHHRDAPAGTPHQTVQGSVTSEESSRAALSQSEGAQRQSTD